MHQPASKFWKTAIRPGGLAPDRRRELECLRGRGSLVYFQIVKHPAATVVRDDESVAHAESARRARRATPAIR